MPRPTSTTLRQLRLSEPKEDHKSSTGRRAGLTGAVVKAPTHAPKVRQTAVRARKGNPEHLLIHTHPPDDPTSYERELSVITAVSRIPALVDHAPRIVNVDPSSGVIVLSTPKLYWNPFWHSLEAGKFGLEQLLDLKEKLRSYVVLLYSHGVAYRVKHDFVFPARTMSGRWVLYLGGWMDADFCPDPSHLELTEWREREAKQLNEIERLFDLLARRCEDIQDERKGQPGYRCDKWTLKEQLKPQT
ncbi:uncharacterized protein N7459_002280 [Penicillium hispanicum]|uniref:uncharacterized protein n=1 Tax=Penicillium hispanicum TaxID=1080232 RepID=UPI0025417CCD|nr:uncharacterized protein N7459_002280 [Penicillium hispanicum]KAJ5591911.1 hypothetical protein N7459_002280 [Penicillium hispanicum]